MQEVKFSVEMAAIGAEPLTVFHWINAGASALRACRILIYLHADESGESHLGVRHRGDGSTLGR